MKKTHIELNSNVKLCYFMLRVVKFFMFIKVVIILNLEVYLKQRLPGNVDPSVRRKRCIMAITFTVLMLIMVVVINVVVRI